MGIEWIIEVDNDKPLIYKGFGGWCVKSGLGIQGGFPTWISALLYALGTKESPHIQDVPTEAWEEINEDLPFVDGPSWWTEPQGEVIATVQVESVDTETNTIWLKPVDPKK